MKYLLVFCFSIVSLSISAQPGSYHKFAVGSNVKVFGDKVNVRATASTDAAVIARLPIAHDVEIVLETTVVFTLNGVSSNWYQIKFEDQGITKEGFVWGGLLACYFLTGEDDLLFLYGMIKNSEEEAADTEIRAVQNGVLIDQISFHPVGWDHHFIGGEIEDNRGIEEIDHVIRIHASREACGYENGNVIIFWDGSNLIYFAHEIGMGDGGVLGYDTEYIFPDDERYNDLVFRQDSETTYIVEIKNELEYDDVGNGKETKTTRILKWKDDKLVRVPASWEN